MSDAATTYVRGRAGSRFAATDGFGVPEWDAALEAYRRLEAQATENEELRKRLARERAAAHEHDLEAAGKAKRERKPAPRRSTVKTDAAIGEAEFERDAIERGRLQAADELERLLAEHGETWAAAIEADAPDVDEHLAVVDALEEAIRARMRVNRLVQWLRKPKPGSSFAGGGGRVPGLLGRNGDPYPLETVLAALAGMFEAPAERDELAERRTAAEAGEAA
jgi:hypothetical protein